MVMNSGFMKCPRCQNSVISGIATCQFCGEDLRGLAPTQKRSMFVDPDSHEVVHTGGRPKWVYPAYYAVSGWFLVSGLIDIIQVLTNPKIEEGFLKIILIVVPAVRCLLGLGLIAKIEFVRGIVNFVCGISLIFSIIGLLSSFASILALGGMGVLVVVMNVVNICTYALMIYLIGETD
jgi:hypothetical protein